MAKKASALSNGLPIPSKVMMCPKYAGRDMCTSMSTKTNGTYSMLISFKQPASRKYAYQVQIRSRHKMASDGTWAAWSQWQPAPSKPLSAAAKQYNRGDGLPFASNMTELGEAPGVSPDYWLTANVGYSTASDYKTAIKLTNQTITSTYALEQFQVRVRTYDGTRFLHGKWASSDLLTVYRRSAFQQYSECYYRSDNGGLRIDFNVLKPDVGGTVTITSLKDAKGRSLITEAWAKSVSKNSAPVIGADGTHTAVTATIPRNALKRNITYGEVLTVSGKYVSKTGVVYALSKSVRVKSRDASFNGVDIRATYDEEQGVLVVKCRRKDANDSIHKCSCNFTYTYNGKRYSVAPTSAQKSFAATQGTKTVFAKFTFKGVPNVANNSKISVTCSSTLYGAKNYTTSLKRNFGGNLFIFNNVTYRGSNATCWIEGKITQSVKGRSSIRLPDGSSLPFATIKKGRSNAITFTGTVYDVDERYPSASRFKWEALAKKGAFVCDFCSPAGHKMRVLVIQITLSQSRDGKATVTVSMQEVRA